MNELDYISNLIADMVVNGATKEELTEAIDYSQEVIALARKHNIKLFRDKYSAIRRRRGGNCIDYNE